MTRAALGAQGAHHSLWKAGLLAAVLAAAGNCFLYLICYATGIIPWGMLSPGRGVSLTPPLVIGISIGGALAGTLIYAVLKRTSANPARAFRHAAVVILAISYGTPFLMGMFSPILALALDVMHTVVAAATVWALTVWGECSRLGRST